MKKKLILSVVTILIILICGISFADEWRGSDEEGWWYSFSNGGYAKNQWLTINNTKYYFDASGYMATGWKQINGQWYYFNSSGKYATGWFTTNNKWYYADKNGAMQTGWLKLNDNWYYLSNSGDMVTGWNYIGTWYYFKSTGEMATGWFKDDGNWYYADKDGAYQTGWLQYNDTWYYLNSDGSMAIGFTDISGVTYYFDQSGAMKTGWVTIDDSTYYFRSSGEMARDTIIDKKYYINADGKWIKQTLTADKDSIIISDGNSTVVNISFLLSGTLTYNVSTNKDILSLEWGGWNNHITTLTITPKKAGSTIITISNNVNSEQIVIPVNITAIKWTTKDANTMMKLLNNTLDESNDSLRYGSMYLKYNRSSYGSSMLTYHKSSGKYLKEAIDFASERVDLPSSSGSTFKQLLNDAYAIYTESLNSETYLELDIYVLKYSQSLVPVSDLFTKFAKAILNELAQGT